MLTYCSYNARSHPLPFMKASNVVAPAKQKKVAPDLEEAIEEEDDAELIAEPKEDDEEEIDFKKDKYIKQQGRKLHLRRMQKEPKMSPRKMNRRRKNRRKARLKRKVRLRCNHALWVRGCF